jgi:hypothetical protein
MKWVAEAIQKRLTDDDTLESLIGQAGQIYNAQTAKYPLQAGTVTFMYLSGVPGDIDSDDARTDREIYQFNIFSQKCEEIVERIFKLLHNYQFPQSSSGAIKACTKIWEGPDEFDEDLQVEVRHIRFMFEIARSAFAPV